MLTWVYSQPEKQTFFCLRNRRLLVWLILPIWETHCRFDQKNPFWCRRSVLCATNRFLVLACKNSKPSKNRVTSNWISDIFEHILAIADLKENSNGKCMYVHCTWESEVKRLSHNIVFMLCPSWSKSFTGELCSKVVGKLAWSCTRPVFSLGIRATFFSFFFVNREPRDGQENEEQQEQRGQRYVT